MMPKEWLRYLIPERTWTVTWNWPARTRFRSRISSKPTSMPISSVARELCARVESAKIFVSHEGGARYGFDHEKIKDGDTFKLGSVLITVRHTPGHTPEHVAYLLAEKDHTNAPWGVLTGDSLFVSSAGRPDLLGSGQAKTLAE